MKLLDGPMEGVEVDPSGWVGRSVVFPAGPVFCGQEGCTHYTQHHYSRDGRWLHSETDLNPRWWHDQMEAELDED